MSTHHNPSIPCYAVRELRFESSRVADDEFAKRRVDLELSGPTGVSTVPAFYDGDGNWIVRWTPDRAGLWRERLVSEPPDPGLVHEAQVRVDESDHPGFVRATPQRNWGYSFDDGTPALVFGDTAYNLFGAAHCGLDVGAFLRRRAKQGFTLIRVRIPVSSYHPSNGYSRWQTRSCFPWGGSEQTPQFDRFNFDYFRTVDEVVRLCGELGLGMEFIMQAWGFEFPFNARDRFTAEWEALWPRYLVARYDAFPQLWMWTPMNEYEQYPDGHMTHRPVGDLWLQRISRLVKTLGRHCHPVVAHNGVQAPPFAQRWLRDPTVVDAVHYQYWGSRGQHAWLTEGVEELLEDSFDGFPGTRVLAEWGYERNPGLEMDVPTLDEMGVEHTRRGAWRAVFAGVGLIHGFQNTWGPNARFDEDQSGVAQLQVVRSMLERLLPWWRMAPATDLGIRHTPPQLETSRADKAGLKARALATTSLDVVAVYLPVGGALVLPDSLAAHEAKWIDPTTGKQLPCATAQQGQLLPRRETRDRPPALKEMWDMQMTGSCSSGIANPTRPHQTRPTKPTELCGFPARSDSRPSCGCLPWATVGHWSVQYAKPQYRCVQHPPTARHDETLAKGIKCGPLTSASNIVPDVNRL